jgi:hypothetical protein
LPPQGGQHGHVRPVILRDGADDPLPAGRPAIQPGQREVDARCIDALEARRVARRDLCLLGRARLLDSVGLALIGMERLFLRGSFRERTMRPRVGTLTRRPC